MAAARVGVSEAPEEDDSEETVEATIKGIRVERGSDSKWRDRPYGPFVGFRLAEEYQGRWKEISEYLGILMQPEAKTPKYMQQFSLEATKYLVSDELTNRRLKTNEPPANILVSTEI